MKRAFSVWAYFLACSFPSNGFLSSFLASKMTRGKPFSSSNKKSIKPFFVDSKFSPKASMSFWVSFAFGSSEMFACPFSLSKNRQPACSSSLFIFIRAFASLEFAIIILKVRYWKYPVPQQFFPKSKEWGSYEHFQCYWYTLYPHSKPSQGLLATSPFSNAIFLGFPQVFYLMT